MSGQGGSGAGGLFGNTNTTGASSGSLFGNLGNNQQSTASTGNTQPSPFGSAGGDQGNQGGGLFGGGNTSTGGNSSGSTFGMASKPEENKSNTSNVFGSLGTPNKDSGDSSNAQRPLFGNPGTNPGSFTPATKTLQGDSTTPAGPPPDQSGSLFGQNISKPGGIFGQTPSTNKSNLFGGDKSQPQTQTTSATSNVFGNNPQESSSSQPGSTSSLFQTNAAKSGSNLFGGQTPQQLQDQDQGANKTSDAGATNQQSGIMSPPKLGLFGAQNTSGTSAGSSSAQTTSAPKPAFSFPTAAATTSSTQQPSTTATTGSSTATAPNKQGLFSAPSSSAAPSVGLFSGLSANTESQAPSTTATSTAAATSSQPTATSAGTISGAAPSLLAGSKPSTTSADQTSEAPATTTTQAATSTQGATTTQATGSAEPTQATGGGLGASVSAPPPPRSRLHNKSMDDIITQWASDLSKYQKQFQSQADKVAAWDRSLVENSQAIQTLYQKAYRAEKDTTEVQKQLSAVENQQDELEQWLDKYEGQVEEMTPRAGQGEGSQGPDQERERTLKTAERVSDRLREMGDDLTSMINEINTASAAISKSSKPDDPLSQIVRILNGHLAQLQSVDVATAELNQRVATAQRDSQRLETRGRVVGNDAASEFYRSYMGRARG